MNNYITYVNWIQKLKGRSYQIEWKQHETIYSTKIDLKKNNSGYLRSQ